MAFKSKITAISLVVLASACSKAPNYNGNVNSGEQAAATAVDAFGSEVGHDDKVAGNSTDANGTMPTTQEEAKKDPNAPANTPPPATNTPPPAAALSESDKAKAIATKGFAAYAVAAPNGQGWNTAQTPFLIGQTVNANAALDTAKPVDIYFCNFQAGNMTIHSSSGNGPMQHGNAFAGTALGANETLAGKQAELDKKTLAEVQAMTNCKAHRVTALGTQVGATYNHQGGAGNNQASYIYFKMYTVDPQGVVALKQP